MDGDDGDDDEDEDEDEDEDGDNEGKWFVSCFMTTIIRAYIHTARKMSKAQHSILSLPLVPRAARLQANLFPDPVTPSPASICGEAGSQPSMRRRARMVGQGSHFSWNTPLTLGFPYEFPDSAMVSGRAYMQCAAEMFMCQLELGDQGVVYGFFVSYIYQEVI